MFSAYSLPPGYSYSVDVDENETVRLLVLDRAGEGVLSVPQVGIDGFKIVHHVIRANPEWLRHHTPDFLVWRLNESPLTYRVRRPDEEL